MSKKGFTLVELIIVLALVAVLSAVSVVSIRSVQQSSYNSFRDYLKSDLDYSRRLSLREDYKKIALNLSTVGTGATYYTVSNVLNTYSPSDEIGWVPQSLVFNDPDPTISDGQLNVSLKWAPLVSSTPLVVGESEIANLTVQALNEDNKQVTNTVAINTDQVSLSLPVSFRYTFRVFPEGHPEWESNTVVIQFLDRHNLVAENNQPIKLTKIDLIDQAGSSLEIPTQLEIFYGKLGNLILKDTNGKVFNRARLYINDDTQPIMLSDSYVGWEVTTK